MPRNSPSLLPRTLSYVAVLVSLAGCGKQGEDHSGDVLPTDHAYYDAFTRVTAKQAKNKKYKPIAEMEAQPNLATEEALQSLEQKLGHTLPTEYREFLRDYNGVSFPSPNVEFSLPNSHGEEDVGRIEQFFSVDGAVNIAKQQDSYEFNKRVPPGFISISEWNGYFRVCICMAGDERGAIFWWDPGLPWETDEETVPTRQYLTKVANNFREFWGKLRPGQR